MEESDASVAHVIVNIVASIRAIANPVAIARVNVVADLIAVANAIAASIKPKAHSA